MPNQNIIQRRVSASATLPITRNDVGKQTRHRQRLDSSFSPYDRTSPIRWIFVFLVSMAIALLIWKPPTLSFFGFKTQTSSQHQDESLPNQQQKSSRDLIPRSRDGHSALPLSHFSELSFALQNSDLVALYFAASWCPMSTPISLALDEAFGKSDMLLTPGAGGERKTLSIVYISSDKTLYEYNEYLHDRNWIAIPFESTQRNQLKRHFSTCAHRELEELGMDRKHEIPTIIVIDSHTQGIITTNGADDVDQMGEKSLDHWKDMQGWIRKTTVDVT
mmetsp:Transcript_3447/g.7595  ORF Transcript_3447/g.7595 Transcript_3447/m.7595 type:complete len:276 (+) Transcript_3447:186-1013(+)